MRGLIRLILLVIVLGGGYWAYYVFASADPNDNIGAINAPEGCDGTPAWAPTATLPAATTTEPATAAPAP